MAIDFSYYQLKMDLNWEFRKKNLYISATLVLGGREGGSDTKVQVSFFLTKVFQV